MTLAAILLSLAFGHPNILPARPGAQTGVVDFDGSSSQFLFAISTEGAYRFEKNKPVHAPKSFHPAFVLYSDERVKVTSKPLPNDSVTILSANDSALQVRYSDGYVVRKGAAKPLATGHAIASASAITVAPTGEEYLLVRWEKGECDYSFTIFRLEEDTLKETSISSYGCLR